MEFSNLGSHCSLKYCNQQDFLPFKCESCSKTFCKDHRLQKDHSCEVQNLGKLVISCPVCEIGVEISEHSDQNEALETHFITGQCRKKQSEKCPVRNCKILLTHINSLTCNRCHQKTCLSHRYQDAHNCQVNLYRRVGMAH